MGAKQEQGPLDGPSIAIHSDKVKDVVINLIMKTHLDPDAEFNLLDCHTTLYLHTLQSNLAR